MNLDHWFPASSPTPGLIPPYSWLFATARRATIAVLTLVPASWLGLVLLRRLIWPAETIFWSHELCLVAGFAYAGALSMMLAGRFHDLQTRLAGKNPDLDRLLTAQSVTFHRRRLLVVMPPILATVAISLRYTCLDYLTPFASPTFDALFLAWLFVGFCLILNASALVGRYSEIVRQLGDAARLGQMTRHDIAIVSSFYLRVALLAALFFGFAAIVVFALDIVYAWNGAPWPGYHVLRILPGWLLNPARGPFGASIEAIFEAIFITGLYGAACVASLLYFFLPQWGIHQLLVERKRAVIDCVERELDLAETTMLARRDPETIEKYAHLSQTHEQLEKIPEWPISGQGMVGTLLLIGLPAILVLLREVLVNLFAGLIVR